MKREGDNIVISVKALMAIAGGLLSGGGIGAYGVTAANASQSDTINQNIKELRYEMCELRNDFLESQGKTVRNCR